MTFDTAKITQVILDCDAMPMAKELASPLVDAYLEQFDSFPDSQCETVYVEFPWQVWLDKNTVIVGVMDRIFRDERGLIGHEHKTKGEPRKKKDGTPWADNDELTWLSEISNGIQTGIYALALRNAFSETRPRILMRACIKAYRPEFWPTKYNLGVFEYSDEYLDSIANALLSKAAQIRAARKSGLVPWQLPGLHCTNKYRRVCEFALKCYERQSPIGAPNYVFDPSDPANKALEGVDLTNPDLAILSSSQYQTASQCMEKYRIIAGGYYPKDKTIELDTGTVYHAALAEIYRQHRGEKTNA